MTETNRPSKPSNPRIAILGAGLSGMCMGIQLLKNGFTDFTIFEKADTVGGTWRENTYPGVACDVPSHLYSFSFARNPDWSEAYSSGSEIQAYCEKIASDYGILPHCRFNRRVVSAVHGASGWTLTLEDGEQADFDMVVTAIGGLHTPAFPDIPGHADFTGPAFHSAEWRHDVSLSGKRVGVIGSAASAVQLVPEIADTVASLTVFQRTPNWVLPRQNYKISGWAKKLMRRFPVLSLLRRAKIYSMSEFITFRVFRENSFMQKLVRRHARNYIKKTVADKSLQQKLTPDYPIGCKRILVVDGYLETLQQEHVTLHTDGIAEITATGVTDKTGSHHEFDVLIFATGFEPFNFLDHLEVANTEGTSLKQAWDDKIVAHRTVSVAGFPNLFMLLGPNSGLGHNSVILMIEAQVRYIISALTQMQQKGLTRIAPKQDRQDAYSQSIQEGLKGMVWNGNCASWYKNGISGETDQNHTLWPHSTYRYMREMQHIDLAEYETDA
ncbi:MAG: flavin-containing monooxygenase [Parvibaculales bacterium]